MKKVLPIYIILLIVACSTSSKIQTFPAIEQSAKQTFYDHFNNWAKNGIAPFPESVYEKEQQLPLSIQISEKGFVSGNEIIQISDLKLQIKSLLEQRKYTTPWLIIEFKSHTSNRLMTELFDFLYQENIRYKFI
jgi:hypothetical protein